MLTSKLVLCLIIFAKVKSNSAQCSYDNALKYFKRPTYDFSIRILDKVAQATDFHFVFSPLSTWMQLTILAEGTRGSTQNEIWQVTRYHRMQCFRNKYQKLLNEMDEELSLMSKRSCVIIFNKLLNVSNTYQDQIKQSNAKVMNLRFDDPEPSADRVNDVISIDMDGVINEGIYIDDFNFTMLLISDSAYFKSDWKIPFNPVYTSKETFYSEQYISSDKVDIMTQIGYYNLTEVASIKARVLELPFQTDRISMLIALPISGSSVKDIFFKLQDIRLMTIYSLFKKKGVQLTAVKLPKFKINTDIDNIPELLHDMGVKRIFNPDLADFTQISQFKMYASLMAQIADIEITEGGVEASISDSLIASKSAQEFTANRPFAYLIVDKTLDVILFAGIYCDPSEKR